MSRDLSPSDDPDLDSARSNSGGPSNRTVWILFVLLCTASIGAYSFWIRPAMVRTEDAVQKTRSAQEELRGEVESSRKQTLSVADAVEAVEGKTVRRYEEANREIDEVRGQVKVLEGVVVRTNELVVQGNSDLGARIASKVFQKADLVPVKNRAEALSKEIEPLREEFDAWATLYDELLDGDRGQPIAADKDLVDRFANVDFPTVTALDIQNWAEVLPMLLQPMQDALDQDAPSLIPLEEFTKRVDERAVQIREASEEIRKARLAVLAIEKEAQATRVTADTPTLREALDNREIRQGSEFQAKRAEEIQKNRDVLAKKLADEDTKSEAATVAMEIEAIRKRAALEARFQAAIPEIQAYLKPYTSPGYTQPQGRSMVPTQKSGPVSLSALRGTGALKVGAPDEYDQALQTLVSVTTTSNDRPLMGFPDNVLPRKDLPYLRKVQGLLDEFGPLMVEKGMLAE